MQFNEIAGGDGGQGALPPGSGDGSISTAALMEQSNYETTQKEINNVLFD
jgi:hypothetical protein